MRAAIYTRISTRDKGQDCENQSAQVLSWAQQNGHDVVKVYSDEVSGSGKLKRPQFEQMLSDAAAKYFDVLLFWSLDRFSREGVFATLKYLRQLDEAGVCWRSHTEPYLDSCGVFKEAILAILAAIAKQERLRISERVKAGLDVARANGRVGGRRPRASEPVLLARVLELHGDGSSIRDIAILLTMSPTTVQRIVKGVPREPEPERMPRVPTTSGLGLLKVGE